MPEGGGKERRTKERDGMMANGGKMEERTKARKEIDERKKGGMESGEKGRRNEADI